MLDCQRHLLPSYPCVAAISCGLGVSKDLLTIAGQISVTIDERNLDSSIQCKAQIDQSFVANIVTEQGKAFTTALLVGVKLSGTSRAAWT